MHVRRNCGPRASQRARARMPPRTAVAARREGTRAAAGRP